ncbi:MAG TPA: polysaccharide biosynthesis protein [Flammeovirgaceae bacterium]|nr:polysaccharide biosynthesis protein [Flammeovirgaceae bacterium]
MLARFTNIRILPRWIIVVIDLGLTLLAASLAYLLRFNFDLVAVYNSTFYTGILVFVGVNLLASLATGLYAGIIRYTGLEDGLRVVSTTGLATLLATALNMLFIMRADRGLMPFSVIIIAFLLTNFFLVTYRLLVKWLFAHYKGMRGYARNVMIFGAGDSGQQTRQILSREPNIRVVGFLEDDSSKIGKVLNGVRIYDARDNLPVLFEMLNVAELIISVQNLLVERKKELVDTAIEAGVKVRNVPPVHKWIKGELSVRQIQDINIEDLLGRDAIKIDNYYVKTELSGKRILITGAAGSIGSEIVRQVLRFEPAEVVLFDQHETGIFNLQAELNVNSRYATQKITYLVGDITSRERLKACFEEHRPEVIFHAAAYKHVPLMEGNPTEAVLCNVLGTKHLADLSEEFGVDKFVYISTDKAVNPTNVMGASKRIGEMYIQALNNVKVNGSVTKTRFITTRFGNVLGSNGSVIPLFKEQIAHGGPVTVTHPEITRFFMTIPEACQLVLEAAAMGKGGEIFIFDMGESIKIVDLAEKMIQLSGFKPHEDIDIVFTGLRDGEKLYEELLATAEDTIPTYHNKILIAKVAEHPFFQVSKEVDALINLARNHSDLEVVQKMKIMVPEYKSNSSKYEALDGDRLSQGA